MANPNPSDDNNDNERTTAAMLLRSLRQTFAHALTDFSQSSSSFRILHSVTSSSPAAAGGSQYPFGKLFVLDSSFNPPTIAHMQLITSALREESDGMPPRRVLGDGGGGGEEAARRVLLLLATSNADKAPKPAAFEDRLVMMVLMGQELVLRQRRQQQRGLAEPSDDAGSDGGLIVDVGVTKLPYFKDKAKAIAESQVYGDEGQGPEQVHLTGYDTIVRIFDPKYYDEAKGGMGAALSPFFEKCRVRVTYRLEQRGPSGKEHQVVEQDEYLARIQRGEREREGVRREWADRVRMVENKLGDGISSTKARGRVKEEDWRALKDLVDHEVAEYIKSGGLYHAEQ